MTHRESRRSWTRWSAGLSLMLALATPSPAHAWDPSTTHLAMLERSVLDSAMHLRWMEASLLQRGVFTPLRLDPERLPPATLRAVQLAVRSVHAASGAQVLGGPGACPGASAPEATRARCVEGDLWEGTALSWMSLGVVVETMPTERLLHHFVDRNDPSASAWTDDDLPRGILRSKHGRAGGGLAARATGSAFEGTGRSALAWLADEHDPWAPPALARHLQRASLAPTQAERDHHLALALICTGALLHVLQDLSVPAHARGDVSAMFLPLSDVPGDRGLPLQELARDAYGRGGLPVPVALSPRPAEAVGRGISLAPTLVGHVLGHGDHPGLVKEAGRRYFSESSLPGPRTVAEALDPGAAAAVVLEGAVLDPSEREGARLSAWPSERGYLIGGSGRPLAAFYVDERERVRLWLDRRVYRTQMQQLVPLGVEAGRSVIDLVHGGWPAMRVDRQDRSIVIEPGTAWKQAMLTILVQDGSGQRQAKAEVELQGEAAHRVVDVWGAELPEGSTVVLVLHNPAGVLPAVAEMVIDPRQVEDDADASPGVPKPTLPRARTQAPGTTRGAGAPRRAVGGETPTDEAAEAGVPEQAAPVEDVATDDGDGPE
ncbi:hypothetical protein [Paraliomyxa miuraensis]|uniref:hypothetical protein n=1 Tax=Paraliomyxa miuraensis TaxID=376150 RepID=UPI002255FFAE|nr:hypothetical protein [Paraliomyxa miuraensis]MCX4244565.1 hypothetical protein [Paraliomyxa miuraensis]